MVSRQIILDTVKRMYSSGVDDETIKITLKEIGLSDKEIGSYLSEAKGPEGDRKDAEELEEEFGNEEEDKGQQGTRKGKGQEEDESKEAEEEEEDTGPENFEGEEDMPFEDDEKESLAEKTAQKVKSHLDSHLQARDLHDETAMNVLEDQREQVGSMHKKIDELHEKISSVPPVSPETIAKINLIEKKLISVEKTLADIKASEAALQSLLKKVLEANKEILNHHKK